MIQASNDSQLYGYIPTEWVCIVFVVAFSLSTIAHLGQSIRYKLPWLAYTLAPAGLLEILGWAGRLWNAISPRLLEGYLMQIVCLILAPAFFMAAMYLTLGLIINKLGPEYSRISPRWYTIVFCTGDVISLVVQAVGGAQAALAVQSTQIPRPDPDKGARVMVGGIIFQMAVMVAFVLLGTEFLVRWATKRPFARRAAAAEHLAQGEKDDAGPRAGGDDYSASERKRWKILLAAVALATLFVFIRSIYRTIELLDGWTGTIIREQPLFNFLDGMMIIFAFVTINLLHPGWLLDTRNRAISLGMRKKRGAAAVDTPESAH